MDPARPDPGDCTPPAAAAASPRRRPAATHVGAGPRVREVTEHDAASPPPPHAPPPAPFHTSPPLRHPHPSLPPMQTDASHPLPSLRLPHPRESLPPRSALQSCNRESRSGLRRPLVPPGLRIVAHGPVTTPEQCRDRDGRRPEARRGRPARPAGHLESRSLSRWRALFFCGDFRFESLG